MTDPLTPLPAAAPCPALSLNGVWAFGFDGPTVSLPGFGRDIRSPGVWQTQFPALRNAAGTGRYRREVTIPGEWRNRALHLVMEGVFHQTTILVDEQPVARHDDGWTTIDVDLTAALAGKSRFTLGIDAVLPDERAGDGRSLGETFAAKQDWYGLQGGIWKPARLEARNPLHIATLAVRADYDGRRGLVSVAGALSQPPQGARLRLTLRRDGIVAVKDAVLSGAAFEAELTVDDVAPWSPDAPNLYALEVALFEDSASVAEVVDLGLPQSTTAAADAFDALHRAVGFRQFEAREGRLYLNGRPFEMFGALDQDWHPEEECRAPTPAFLEQRFRNAKAMGLNTLRCHVKIPDKLYFELADRLGLVVWLDMPYCEFLTQGARAAIQRIFHRCVAEHASHPSICIWTLFNEGWGIDLDDNPDDRRLLGEFFDEAKATLPGSLVVDNSPCFPRNYHIRTDIEDFHWYNAFPHQNAAFAATTAAFARRADFAFSPHGDGRRNGDEPLICSEFGVWGLPHIGDILEKGGAEPWWFESGHDWNLGAAYPHGVETRFRDTGLARIFGDLDGFTDAAQELQFRALKSQIETLRWAPKISGYVITELNDVQWESNGLMDVRNNPRRFAERLANLQTPCLAIACASRTAIAVGETIDVELRLAGAEIPEGAVIAWRFGGATGRIAAAASPTKIVVRAPPSEGVSLCDLELEALDGKGRLLSRNRLEFSVAPPLGGDVPALYPLDESATRLLLSLRWPNVVAEVGDAQALLATRLTTPVRERLLAGGRVLLIANSSDALADPDRALPASDRHNFPKMELRERRRTPWDGQWMGAFGWRRTDGPWAALPGGPLLDEHWIGLLPEFVLTGFLSTAYAGLVDAGVVVAWLHHAAAFSKRTRLGKGLLTATTFALSSPEAALNPLAPHLLAALANS